MPDTAKQLLANATATAAAEKDSGKSTHHPLSTATYTSPGRLGNPAMDLQDDPRVNPKLLAAVTPLGMNKFNVSPTLATLNENSSLDQIAALISEFEDGIGMIYSGKVVPLDHPLDATEPKVDQTEETIKGGDGQDMKVYIYHPADQGEQVLSGVVYTHGGGMVINSTFNPVHDRWCRSLAAQGVVVIMPDFRNAYTKTGYNHYPRGLNDCIAALKWTIANKSTLKIRNIVLTGESGGGNLAIAQSLQANRDGWIKEISGVYPLVPYISNLYGASEERKLKELPSLIENHGYFLNTNVNAWMGYFYTPNDKDMADPLAWPYHATEDMMKGLPPHVVVMDELDPLRDEGFAYARRLARAGVEVKSAMNLGVLHGTSLLFRKALPELHIGTAREIAAFAKSL